MAGFQLTLYGRIWVTPKAAARTAKKARHRLDRSMPQQQQTTALRRWPQTQELQTSLNRAIKYLVRQFRRLLVRHEHLLATYRAFFYLACFWITLRRGL